MTRGESTRALLGIPYRPGGRDTENGLDCLGLVIVAFDLPEIVSRTRPDEEVRHLLDQHFRPVPTAGEDDLFVMKRGRRWHFAISSGEGFVHADIKARKIIAREGALPWPLFGIFRRISWPH